MNMNGKITVTMKQLSKVIKNSLDFRKILQKWDMNFQSILKILPIILEKVIQ